MANLIGQSTDANVPGVLGENTSANGLGTGVFGKSQAGEGVHGETNSTQFAAVAGIALNPESPVTAVYGEHKGKGSGVVGKSQAGEGVHGETNSTQFAAVAGIALNPESPVTAVYGEHKGKGSGVVGKSQAGEGVHGETNSTQFAAVAGIALNPESPVTAVYGEHKGKGSGVVGKSQAGEGVHGETSSTQFAAIAGIALNPDGTGAGIYGESKGKGPAGFFKGDVLVTGDIKLINADCAEDFDIAGLEKVEPGTVMVIDSEGALQPSSQAYDKRVAGVISGAGNYKPGLILDKQESSNNRMPIALMGKVYCKADANYGVIEVGDLLTTSPSFGYAMKATDPFKAFGAVIGKALRPLHEGQGLIPILIALQ